MKPRRTTVTNADTGISPGWPSRCRPVGRVRFITMLTALLDSVDHLPAGDAGTARCVARGITDRDLLPMTLRVRLVAPR
jgi:hypothetical protein